MVRRNTCSMGDTYSAVSGCLYLGNVPQVSKLSLHFLEVLSFAIMRGGADLLWSRRKESFNDWNDYISLILLIFDSTNEHKSHQDLLCILSRHQKIWDCILNVFAYYDRNPQYHIGGPLKCRYTKELKLVVQMIPFIRGHTAKGLLSKSTFIEALMSLLLKFPAHIVCLAARALTTLLLGKHGSRVVKRLLFNDTISDVIGRVFINYLSGLLRSGSYFKECPCNEDECTQWIQSAMHDVLQVCYALFNNETMETIFFSNLGMWNERNINSEQFISLNESWRDICTRIWSGTMEL